jgi:cysteine synthase A
MAHSLTSVSASVLQAIGRTPVVRLRKLVPPGAAEVLVKLEFFAPTGSYKDRMALAMIEGAERRGVLKPGMRVVEFTGGSTGSSLAMVCAAKGYRLVLLSSDAFAEEKLRTMRALGADLRLVPSDGGKVTPAPGAARGRKSSPHCSVGAGRIPCDDGGPWWGAQRGGDRHRAHTTARGAKAVR